ncbi:EndoS/ChiA family endoglycosidase [Chitinophaga qingshengii]|uniref:mannosyl-glycoprotein endo-beta-N-acetylglucosaminidase n=1 Tax=Chitinophaga qingshengii TaxID=1569794 RepID=A0ABR7TNG9_9BACT|nr:glycosyl hydrolase family 18 protein [Chitinophaga qingshengii]MBC9932029.1 endo-beta-N-acetylglucosaminidase [Chitinophaga qingshengii]
MKQQCLSFSLVTVLMMMLFGTSCTKELRSSDTAPNSESLKASVTAVTESLDSLLAYKSRPHEIYAAFYRLEGPCYGPAPFGTNFSQVPDSLDVLILFCFSPSSPVASQVPGWINTLHTKGTKVILTGNLNLIPGATHDSVGYAMTARYIMDSVVNKYGFDGYDIDIESQPSGQTLTDMAGVYKALSRYLGPKSGTGRLLTFDTNQSGSNSLFQKVYTMVDYVWLQAYGRGASTLQGTWATFAPYITSSQFVPGFSFYEERGDQAGNVWYDITYPVNGTGRAYDYARWEPASGKKGGVFGYAIDRDAPLTSSTDNNAYAPTYIVSKQLIQIMNPANGSSGATGVVFYQDANYGGAASQPIAKGSYTLSQLQAKGVVNDWASSVKIPAGWSVTIYADDNFSGTSWTLTSNNSWLGGLSPSANDKMSAAKIQ